MNLIQVATSGSRMEFPQFGPPTDEEIRAALIEAKVLRASTSLKIFDQAVDHIRKILDSPSARTVGEAISILSALRARRNSHRAA